MNIDSYLHRINYRGSRSCTLGTLQGLHEAHMLTVPFENLDIHIGRPIILHLPALFNKIVEQRRGGFCFELNGLFSRLLQDLGFQVTLVSARVYDGNVIGPENDHLALLIWLDEVWLADVGFGDSSIQPLRLVSELEQTVGYGTYRLLDEGSTWRLQALSNEGLWTNSYAFSTQPRQLIDFIERCAYLQTSPESHFTQKTICSRATPEGRVTLSNARLIMTENNARHETALPDDAAVSAALLEHFGILLPGLHLTQ